MTVFERVSLATWGSPVSELTRVQKSGDEEIKVGGTYEAQIPLTFDPREPTPRELYATASEFVRRWESEHPDTKTTYIEVSHSSPQYLLRIQFTQIHASPLLPLAVIVSALISIFLIVCVIVLIGIVVTAGAAVIFGIIKLAPVIGYAVVGIGIVVFGLWAYRRFVRERAPPPRELPTKV